MYKITNKQEFEKLVFEGKIPPIIANQVYGDLLMFGEFMKEEYPHNEKSAVVIVSKNEFEKIDVEFEINLEEYEYKDVIGVNDRYYIEKLLFIKNNVNNKIKVTNFGEKTFTNYGIVTSSRWLLFSLCYNFLIVQRRLS